MDKIINEVDNMNAAQLIGTLHQTFALRIHVKQDSSYTRKDVKRLQQKIALTLWTKFPEAARAEGLKKVKIS